MNIFQKQLNLNAGNQNALAINQGWDEIDNEQEQKISSIDFLRQTDKAYYCKDGQFFIRNTQ